MRTWWPAASAGSWCTSRCEAGMRRVSQRGRHDSVQAHHLMDSDKLSERGRHDSVSAVQAGIKLVISFPHDGLGTIKQVFTDFSVVFSGLLEFKWYLFKTRTLSTKRRRQSKEASKLVCLASRPYDLIGWMSASNACVSR